MAGITDVRNALEAQVANISGVPSAANQAWENVPFEPTLGTAWVRMTFTPLQQRPTDVTATGLKRIDATFTIDIFAPDKQGPKEAEDLAEAVIAAYAPGVPLTSNGVSTQIEWAEAQNGAVFDPPWYAVSVTVKTKTYVS